MDKIKVGNKWVCLKERKEKSSKETKIGERDNNMSEIMEELYKERDRHKESKTRGHLKELSQCFWLESILGKRE